MTVHEGDSQAVPPVRSGEAGHTPGPWVIAPDLHSDKLGISSAAGVVVWAHDKSTPSFKCGVNGKANARLIAASPDLDTAADEAWKALAWIIHYDSEDKALARAMKLIEAARKKAGTYDYDAMRAQVEATGRATIAKATGAQS